MMDLELLELRRIKTDLTMYFKICQRYHLITSPMTKKCEYIIQPFCPTHLFVNDFLNTCVSCFNGLPESVVCVSSKIVAEFKRRLTLICHPS